MGSKADGWIGMPHGVGMSVSILKAMYKNSISLLGPLVEDKSKITQAYCIYAFAVVGSSNRYQSGLRALTYSWTPLTTWFQI